MADENDININIGVNPSQAEAGSRRTKTALNSVTKESKEMDAALRRLKSSIDPTFAATEKYNKALADTDRLLKAQRISQQEATAARNAAKASLDAQIASINKMSAASKAATEQSRRERSEQAAASRRASQDEINAARLATQEKINLARKERAEKARLEQQERQAIRLAAQVARQAAVEAQRTARPVSSRAVGRVAPGSIDSTQSLRQLEYNIERAMGKLVRLTQEAETAAARAAAATSVKVAQSAEETARRRASLASETKERILQMERELASQRGALEQQAAAEIKAARDAEKAAARSAAQAAVAASKEAAAAKRQEAVAAREAARAVQEQAKAEKQAATAVHELRASIDPAYAAQMRYNETMARATQLLMQNKLQTGEWTRIQKQAKAQMDLNVRSLGRQNAMYVQLGYQAQDVTASLASGINPLVILAQQGGQTAAALSGMGGTIGRVAAFMAGPWGAAIIGFTLLLGFLWDSNKKGKESTLDLMDAESRRAAKLPDLIDKIKEFNKEQRESNTLEAESLRLKGLMVQETRNEAQKKLNEALRRVAELKQSIDFMMKNPSGAGDGSAGALAALYSMLNRAEKKVKELREEIGLLGQGDTELNLTNAMRNAEAATDAATAATQAYEVEVSRIQRIHRDAEARLRRGLTGDRLQVEIRKLQVITEGKLAEAIRKKEAAIKAARDAERGSNNTQTTSQYMMPVQGSITSGVGRRQSFRTNNGAMASTNHAGIDISAPLGTMVRAANDATVAFRGWVRGYGNMIELDHGAGVKTRYAHLQGFAPGLQQGSSVARGDAIGTVGQTGNATGPHLHYEVRINGKPATTDQIKKGIFSIDQLASEKAGLQDLERAQHDAAQTLVATYARAQEEIEANTSLSNEEQMAQVLELQDKKIAALTEGYGKESKEVEDAERQKYQIIQKYNAMILAATVARIRKESQLAETRETGSQDVEVEQLGGRSDEVDYRASSGIVSERQALVERAEILDQEYGMQQRHEERMYQLKTGYLRQELTAANQTPERQREILTQLEIMEQEHLNRRMIAQEQYARKVADVNRQQAEITMNKWREITQTFTGSVTSAFQGLWTRSITVQQALINMADQMVYKFVDITARAAQSEIENWIRVHILKQNLDRTELATKQVTEAAKTGTVLAGQTAQTGARVAAATTETTINTATAGAKVAAEAIKTGAAVTGATTQTGVAAAAGMTEIGTNAAVAAAGAYKSTVVIPFIGPVAAPAAAALALAAVLGFGALISARGGQGEVGEDGQLSLLHKKEMVLPEKFASPLRAALTTRSSSGMLGAASAAGSTVRESMINNNGGDNASFYYQPKHTNMGASMETLLRQDGRSLRKWLKNEMRNGGLKFNR